MRICSAFEASLLAELRAAIKTQLEVAHIDGNDLKSFKSFDVEIL